MYNEELFEKIINVEISLEKLMDFNQVIDKREFDLVSPFSKYYSLNTIFKAIDKYRNHKIDENYFSSWCNAYNWIINGGFKEECMDNDQSPIEFFAMSMITDTLDGLSFFDSLSTTDKNDLIKEGLYCTDFILYDKLLKTGKEWEVLLVKGWQYEFNCEYGAIFINKKTKEYFLEITEDSLDLTNEDILEIEDFIKLVKELNIKGYANVGSRTVEDLIECP